MTKTLLIEADEILYRTAFAVQKTNYIFRSKSGNERDLGNNLTKTKIVKFMRANGKELNLDYTLERYFTAEPVSHCIKILKSTLSRLSAFGKPKLFLSSSDHSNFRYGIATTPGPKGVGYKAGRPERPIHYKELRKYMIEKLGAIEVYGMEADDALGINQNEDTIAVHIDKDINTVPGEHINWVTGEHYTVPEGLGTVEMVGKKAVGRGRKFFYHQLLTGDAIDNIAGLPGIGDKTAFEILKDCTTEQECFEEVNYYYHLKLGDSCDVVARLEEVADLLWILQDKNMSGRHIIGRFL